MPLSTSKQAVFDQLAAKAAATVTEDVPLTLKDILTNIVHTIGRPQLVKHIENLVDPSEATKNTPALTPAPVPTEDTDPVTK